METRLTGRRDKQQKSEYIQQTMQMVVVVGMDRCDNVNPIRAREVNLSNESGDRKCVTGDAQNCLSLLGGACLRSTRGGLVSGSDCRNLLSVILSTANNQVISMKIRKTNKDGQSSQW